MKPRPWELYVRKQKYSECQVITAINVYACLTGKTVDPNSKKYERLVDLAKARHGSAIQISKVHDRLGIEPAKKYPSFLLVTHLPFELFVWHKNYGYHSVAVVEFEPRTASYRIPNFERATSSQGWIYREDLHHFVRHVGLAQKWEARTFRIKR